MSSAEAHDIVWQVFVSSLYKYEVQTHQAGEANKARLRCCRHCAGLSASGHQLCMKGSPERSGYTSRLRDSAQPVSAVVLSRASQRSSETSADISPKIGGEQTVNPDSGAMSKSHRTDAGAEADRSAKAQVSQVAQLFARLQQEIEEARPRSAIQFIVDFLCKHYPEHLKGFASVWNAGAGVKLFCDIFSLGSRGKGSDPELERERLMVVEFFKAQKLPTDIAAHFTSAGFDTLETLCTLTAESLDDIEKFNQTRWLPGHKVRLQQTFADIAGRVRAFTEERDYHLRAATGYCPHPQVVSKQSLIPIQQTSFSPSFPPSTGTCCSSSPNPVTYPAPSYAALYGPPSPPVITYSSEVTRN